MSKGTATHGTPRLVVAALAAATAAIALGPDELRHQSFAAGMAVMVLLGGWIRSRTDEGGLMGRIATGALGLLLLAPAVGTRVRMVSEALSSVDSTSPHTAVADLPGTAASVVASTGPLMFGAGLALLILGGRLGGPVTGALFGGATAAWGGYTLAAALDRAIGAERFEDLVMLSQGLRFVGLLTLFGTFAGIILARQGRKDLVAKRLEALRIKKRQDVIDERRALKAAEAKAAAEAAAETGGSSTEGAQDSPDALIEIDEAEMDPEEAARVESISTVLYAAPMLHTLDDAEIEAIAPAFALQQLDDGHDLFLEGDSDQTIYFIGRGEVQIWKTGSDKPRFLLARLNPGMMFGEMAVVEKRARSASATTFGQVEVVGLTGEAYKSLTESSPGLVAKIQTGLIQVMAARLRRTSLDLLALAQGQPADPSEGTAKVAKRKGAKVKEEELPPLISPARLFSSLGEEDVKALASTVEKVTFEDGDHLVTVGTNEETMYLITSGRVQIWRRNAQGQKVELAILGPGDPVGEMALFEDDLRSAYATTIGQVETLRLTRATLSKLTDGHPVAAVKLYNAFLEVLSERLRNVSATLVEVAAPKGPPPKKPFPTSKQAVGMTEAADDSDGDLLIDEDDLLDFSVDDDEAGEGAASEEEEAPILVEVHPDEVDPDLHFTKAQLKRHQRTASGLALLAALTAYWASSPPWLSLIRNLPSPSTSFEVPKGEPGLPNAQRPMNPFGPDFAAALEGRGHKRMHSRPWPCLPDVYDRKHGYGSHPRKTETLAVSADTPVIDLAPAIHDMRKRGVYRMGLTGSAKPPYGALGSFLAWPAVQLLIDSPPRTAQWIELHPRAINKLELLPGATKPTACALIIDEEVTVDHLYSTVRSLGSVYGDPTCQSAVVLVLPDDGSTTNPHPGWKGCP